jgi:AraC-like DNA-binding protein
MLTPAKPSHSALADWPARHNFIALVTGLERLDQRPIAAATLERDSFLMSASHYDLSPGTGHGFWRLFRLADDVLVVVTSTIYHSSLELTAPGEGYAEFHFHLSGHMRLNASTSTQMDLSKPCLLIQRQAPGCTVHQEISGSLYDSSVTLYCQPAALFRMLGTEAAFLPAELTGDADGIFRLRTSLYPSLSESITAIAALLPDVPISLARADALIRQALCEIVTLLRDRSVASNEISKLSNCGVAQVRRVRELIIEQHTPPASIAALARSVGMSPTKLKTGFKLVFGKTVHQFGNELRMQKALRRLRSGNESIGNIAGDLGYQYQNSFTVAFRRYFGMLPKDYRRNPLAINAIRSGELTAPSRSS